jgi:hypothetical protein
MGGFWQIDSENDPRRQLLAYEQNGGLEKLRFIAL